MITHGLGISGNEETDGFWLRYFISHSLSLSSFVPLSWLLLGILIDFALDPKKWTRFCRSQGLSRLIHLSALHVSVTSYSHWILLKCMYLCWNFILGSFHFAPFSVGWRSLEVSDVPNRTVRSIINSENVVHRFETVPGTVIRHGIIC